MCGRSSLHQEPKELLESYGLPPRLADFTPRYNIAPSQFQWTILLGPDGRLETRPLRWGLVPNWASDSTMGSRLINARVETVVEKPSFRESLRERRCLVMTDGYYEWQKTAKIRTPFRIRMQDDKPFVFAGLWDRWNKGEVPVESVTIITTPSAPPTAHIHDRMPAILDFEESLEWLRADAVETLLSLLRPYSGDKLESFEVSRAVNAPANDTAECIVPVDEAESRLRSEFPALAETQHLPLWNQDPSQDHRQ